MTDVLHLGRRVHRRRRHDHARRQARPDRQDSVEQGPGSCRRSLLPFASPALLVDSSVIDASGIMVAQRTKRWSAPGVGASRRQVLRSVLLEASVTAVADRCPTVEVEDIAGCNESHARELRAVVNLLDQLLGLAIVIALVSASRSVLLFGSGRGVTRQRARRHHLRVVRGSWVAESCFA